MFIRQEKKIEKKIFTNVKNVDIIHLHKRKGCC